MLSTSKIEGLNDEIAVGDGHAQLLADALAYSLNRWADPSYRMPIRDDEKHEQRLYDQERMQQSWEKIMARKALVFTYGLHMGQRLEGDGPIPAKHLRRTLKKLKRKN